MPTFNAFPNCLRVGLTGGIGSGKSTVAKIFSSLGIPVYNSDEWAKWLIVNDPKLKSDIIQHFGSSAYHSDGSYNRAYIADLVFKDKVQLEVLNGLVHPVLEQHSKNWHAEQADQQVPYTLKEAAILMETGMHRFLDAVILVVAPVPLRIQRVMDRDGIPLSAIEARMNSQWSDALKSEYADFRIENDGLHLLTPQVWQIHRMLIERARGSAND